MRRDREYLNTCMLWFFLHTWEVCVATMEYSWWQSEIPRLWLAIVIHPPMARHHGAEQPFYKDNHLDRNTGQKECTVSWLAISEESPVIFGMLVVEISAGSLVKGWAVGCSVNEWGLECSWGILMVVTSICLGRGPFHPTRGWLLPIPGRKGLPCSSQ